MTRRILVLLLAVASPLAAQTGGVLTMLGEALFPTQVREGLDAKGAVPRFDMKIRRYIVPPTPGNPRGLPPNMLPKTPPGTG